MLFLLIVRHFQQQFLVLVESQDTDEVVVVGSFDRHEGLQLGHDPLIALYLPPWVPASRKADVLQVLEDAP